MNKALVVTGLVNLYGCPRDYITSRLKSDAPNELAKKTILVDQGSIPLDWEVGETIAIASSTMRTMDTEKCVITAILSDGSITCEDDIEHFHFGDA